MIRVYHTPVTDPSSTDTASTAAATTTDTVICWTCLGITVSTGKEYLLCIQYNSQMELNTMYYQDIRNVYVFIQQYPVQKYSKPCSVDLLGFTKESLVQSEALPL